jgi:hypothetical protein
LAHFTVELALPMAGRLSDVSARRSVRLYGQEQVGWSRRWFSACSFASRIASTSRFNQAAHFESNPQPLVAKQSARAGRRPKFSFDLTNP